MSYTVFMTTQNHARLVLPARSVLIAFLVFIFISCGASVAIRRTYVELAPLGTAASRFILAAFLFWVIVFFKRIPLPKGRAMLGALLFGVLTIGLAFILISWGLVATPASRFQILIATVPLLTIFLSALHGIEAISWRGVVGSLIAVAGIAVTAGGAMTSELSLTHIGAILMAAVFIAESGVLIKKFPPNPPMVTNAIAMTVGGFILGITSLVSDEKWTIPTQIGTWIAFLYLVILVTIVSFVLYLFMLNKWSASGTSYGFVLMPFVTIIEASIFAGEEITSNFLVGAGMVLIGVFVGALLPSMTKSAIVEECKDSSGQVLPRCG